MRTRRTLYRSAALLLVLALVPPGPGAAAAADVPRAQPADRTLTVPEPPVKLAGATPQQAEYLRAFETGQQQFEATLREGQPDEAWRLVRVVYPSPVQTPWPENNTVPCELYLPRAAAGRVPAAVVLDIMDGSTFVARALACGLAEQGVAALYVPMACYGPRRPAGGAHYRYYAEHPEKTVDNFRQTVMDIRRGKAVLAALPEVDPGRIGITGVSLGGIMTSLAAGVDGTFHRVVPILAGGDVAAICFHARETRRIREACKAKGITQEQLAAMLRPVEPLTFAGRVDPATCLMINAAKDEVIPPAATAALWTAIGSPQMLTVPVGHYGAGLFLPNIRQRTIDFMLGRPVDRIEFVAPRETTKRSEGRPSRPTPSPAGCR